MWEADGFSGALLWNLSSDHRRNLSSDGGDCYNAMDFEEPERWYCRDFDCLSRCRPFDDLYYHARSTACSKISRIYRYRGGEENWKKALALGKAAQEEFSMAEELAKQVVEIARLY